jgi:hypothetical protein
MTLANNEDQVEQAMMGDPQFQPQVQQFLDGLRTKANVEIVNPRYQAVGEAYKQRREAAERTKNMPPGMGMAPPEGGLPSGRRPGGPPPDRMGRQGAAGRRPAAGGR